MVSEERNNNRDLSFSKWHRTTGSTNYATNIDFLEYKVVGEDVVPVACIEEKHWNERTNTLQRKVVVKVANTLGIPAYQIRHNGYGDKSPNRFEATNLKTGEKRFMDGETCKGFITNLHNM